MRSLPVLVLVVSLASACRTGQSTRTGALPDKIGSEEEFTAVRDSYEGMVEKERTTARPALENYLLNHVERLLDNGEADDAFGYFRQALQLYSSEEVAHADDHPSPRLQKMAQRIETAFRKRGAHKEVVTALMVSYAMFPKDQTLAKRYEALRDWLAQDEDQKDRLVDDLEGTVRVWPSKFVVSELARIYSNPANDSDSLESLLGASRRRGRSMREWLAGTRPSTSYLLARLYLRIGKEDEAASSVKKLEGKAGYDTVLAKMLEKITSAGATPNDWVTLATYFANEGQDRDLAARICKDASVRFPKSSTALLCAGEQAVATDQLVPAIQYYERVIAVDPNAREAWEELARLYQVRLFQAVTDENVNVQDMEAQLKKVEAFHQKARERFPNQPLKRSLAGVVYEVGRGYYNAGRPNDAMRYLERSVIIEAFPPTLELMGQIRAKKGDYPGAKTYFERAMALPKEGAIDQVWWRAKLRRQMGDVLEASGDAAGAENIRQAALRDWNIILGQHLTSEGIAESKIELARLAYAMGDRDASLKHIHDAVDAAPDRGSTYADVIAFLVPRGELEEALDAYHRALGRSEVTDYLKVYCSLWIVDLARRAKQPEDPIATAYLKSANGSKWYDDLARWATGRAPETILSERATTPGRKAEAAFYRAMRAVNEGNLQKAQELWKKVLATDMMAFFEFDMAAYYLRLGRAPSAPIVMPKTEKPKPSSSVPAGSI